MGLFATLSINDTQHTSIECNYAECRYAESRDFNCYAECRHAECHSAVLGVPLLGTHKHWTRLIRLARDKHSSLLQCL